MLGARDTKMNIIASTKNRQTGRSVVKIRRPKTSRKTVAPKWKMQEPFEKFESNRYTRKTGENKHKNI